MVRKVEFMEVGNPHQWLTVSVPCDRAPFVDDSGKAGTRVSPVLVRFVALFLMTHGVYYRTGGGEE